MVPPHRDAFNRTSIIMQYANSRILLLLQRQYYYNNQEQNNNQEQDSSSFSILSGIIVWIFVLFGCIRMLPVKIPDIFSSSSSSTAVAAAANDDTNPDDESLSKNRLIKKKKMMPTFWYNGNTYCFVLPMMISLIGDFIMTIYCEYHYHYHYFHDENNQTSSSSSLSLYDYHTKYWLSISHLLFLQLIAHIIAFSFTLIFRIRDKNKSNKRKSNMSMSNRSTIFNIRTLYWVCTIGVYALVIIGFRKVIKTFQSLHNI